MLDYENVFKTLDEIVKDDVWLNKSLCEGMAIKPKKKLVEEKVNLVDEQEVKKAIDTIEKSEDDSKTKEYIIDANAETEDEANRPHLGQSVLLCCSCNKTIFKNSDEVIKSDEVMEYNGKQEALYNVGEACPNCSSEAGYILVGQIGETPKEVKPEEEVEVKAEVKEEPAKEEENVSVADIEVKESLEEAENKFYVYLHSPAGTELICSGTKEECEKCKAEKDAQHKPGYMWVTELTDKPQKEIYLWDSLKEGAIEFDNKAFDSLVNKALIEKAKHYKTLKVKYNPEGKKFVTEGIIISREGKFPVNFTLENVNCNKSLIILRGLNESFGKVEAKAKLVENKLVITDFGFDKINNKK